MVVVVVVVRVMVRVVDDSDDDGADQRSSGPITCRKLEAGLCAEDRLR